MPPKKKPSLEALMAGETPEPSAPESQPAIEAPARPGVHPATVEKLTVYVPRAAAKRLKLMALDHDKRVNDFLREGVDLMLAKYGEPSLDDFEKKR